MKDHEVVVSGHLIGRTSPSGLKNIHAVPYGGVGAFVNALFHSTPGVVSSFSIGRLPPKGNIVHVSYRSVPTHSLGTLPHQTEIWFITWCPQICGSWDGCMVRTSYTMSLLFFSRPTFMLLGPSPFSVCRDDLQGTDRRLSKNYSLNHGKNHYHFYCSQ